MPVVAVAQHKGGVAKTTTAVTLAAVLAEHFQRRPLLVDFDEQGHASLMAGCAMPSGRQGSALLLEGERVAIADVVTRSAYGFDVLVGGVDLKRADEHLASSKEGAEYRLREALLETGDTYDCVLIDLAPALTDTTMAAFIAATTVICPCTLDHLALTGIATIDRTTRKLAVRGVTPNLAIGAIVATKYSLKSSTARVVYAELLEQAGTLMLRGTVRHSEYFLAATHAECPITKYMPDSIGVDDYREVARELIERGLL